MDAKDIRPGMAMYATIEEFGNQYKQWVIVQKPTDSNIRVTQLSTGDAAGELFIERSLRVKKDQWNDQWQDYKPIPSMHSFFRFLFNEIDSVTIDGEP